MHEIHFLILLGVLNAAVIGAGAWLVLRAEQRRFWQGKMQSALSTFTAWIDARLASATQASAKFPAAVAPQAIRLKTALLRRKQTMLATLALLVFPVLVVQLLAPDAGLESYNDLPQVADPIIAALLRGEQLVPPPPLPPEAFTTSEVEAERSELASASREWTALNADFRQRLLTIYRLMATRGYQMVLIEGYRSPERQAALARLGPQVTNAGAYQSYHQFGLAADSAFYRDGKLVISERDSWAMEGYRLYGQFAESAGLVWGGRWKMMDFGHVELRKPGLLQRN